MSQKTKIAGRPHDRDNEHGARSEEAEKQRQLRPHSSIALKPEKLHKLDKRDTEDQLRGAVGKKRN